MGEAPPVIGLPSEVAKQSLRMCNKAFLLHDREQRVTEPMVIVASYS